MHLHVKENKVNYFAVQGGQLHTLSSSRHPYLKQLVNVYVYVWIVVSTP